MDRIRVILVDDEPLALRGLRLLCEKDPELEVACECSSGRAAVAAIEQVEPDLVLLDIQMPEMDGFEVLEAVGPECMPHVIFVTAYDRFAVRAFEIRALDYLLKPFDDERFFGAIERAKRAIRRPDLNNLRERIFDLVSAAGVKSQEGDSDQNPRHPPPSGKTHLSRIAVKEKGRVHLIRVDKIDWIEAANYRVKIHVSSRTFILRESLRTLESQLEPTRFVRVSRSAIVNLDRIKEIHPFARGSHVVILDDGTRVMLSRSRKDALETLVGGSF